MQYNVTLGARVNPEGRSLSQDIKKEDDSCTSASQPPGASSDVPQACQTQSSCSSGGISALGSSPAENYSYYAKTVLNTEGIYRSNNYSQVLIQKYLIVGGYIPVLLNHGGWLASNDRPTPLV